MKISTRSLNLRGLTHISKFSIIILKSTCRTFCVVALKKLDARAKLPATIFAYTFGIISSLITGFGMCLSMKVIGSGTTAMFVIGVIIGIIGFWGMGQTGLHRFGRAYRSCYEAMC